nr:NADH dehydrogenase [ubiquinone] 1 alpha subcomplex subunit 11 [Vanessa tameamea]
MLSYKYYDTPEGHDIFKKVFVTSKYAGMAGLGVATFDVLMYSHPKGLFNTAYRYAFFLGPMVGMAAAFTVTANTAQNIREKNDVWNYFLGGVASGTVFGAWKKSLVVAVPVCLALGAIGMIKKTAIDENWILVPEITSAPKSIKSVHHDWTLVKDVDELKTWTVGSK